MDLIHELSRRLPTLPLSTIPPLTKALGQLGTELDLRTHFQPANRYSPEKSMMLLRQLTLHPDFEFEVLSGATVVDVGCGGLSPVGQLFALVLAGAHRGIGVDLDSVETPELATRALYNCLASVLSGTSNPNLRDDPRTILARIDSFDLPKIARGDPSGIDENRLSFRNSSLAMAGIGIGSVDIVTSSSFFEHVPEPREIVADMARISRQGGLGVHSIDGFDHRWYPDPEMFELEFLRESTNAPLVAGCNRIRPLAFRHIFEEHGFEVRLVEPSPPIEIDEATRSTFAEPYRSMPTEMLETPRATFFLRRR